MSDDHERHLNEMEIIFKAYADKNRLKIIWLLASKSKENVTVGEIADYLAVSQPAASQHIKILKNVGLLYPKKKGMYVFYKIDLSRFKEIKEKMDFLYMLAYRGHLTEHEGNINMEETT
ncbi:MAG: ArsR/SmtB family transcription factor [Candidatus Kariarchaeaceae archaeon]|jgi:DNA-binding transcriptional ArsR family regulator